MTKTETSLQVPARGRGPTLSLRILILTLDFATIIALFVSLGLYSKWVPRTSYPTTALQPTKHIDWTDLLVLAAVLVSLMWTLFITLRPTWTSEALRFVYHVAFEFTCLAWLLACTIPALVLKESVFRNLVAISNSCDADPVTLMDGQKVPWVCLPHLNALKKLRIAVYSTACAVAIIHLTLLTLTSLSTKHLAKTPTQTENGQKLAHESQNPTTRGSESDHSSTHALPHPRIEVAEV